MRFVCGLLLISLFCLPMVSCTRFKGLVDSPTDKLPIANVDDSEIFALNPDGTSLIYANDGLILLDIKDGKQFRLSSTVPSALAWSRDGRYFVVSYPQSEQTQIVLYSSDGLAVSKTMLEEQVSDMRILDNRILAIAHTVAEHGSGRAQVDVRLISWRGSWGLDRQSLYTLRFRPISSDSIWNNDFEHHFSVSSLQDEIIYCRYLEAPKNDASVEFVLLNLLTGREQVLGTGKKQQSEAFFLADGEQYLYSDENGEVRRVNRLTGQVDIHWFSRGGVVLAAEDRYMFLIDDILYSDRNTAISSFPFSTKAQFSADGSKLLLLWRNHLYLYTIENDSATFQYNDLEKVRLQSLRQLRSNNQISKKEYVKRRNNILNL